MSERPDRMALFFVLSATCGLSFKGIFAKYAYLTGMDVPTLVLLRMSLALPCFWLIGWIVRRGKLFEMTGRDWIVAMLVGLFSLATISADAAAIKCIGASLSRMVVFTFPVMVMIITAVRNHTRPAAHQLFSFVLAYGGLAILLLPASSAALPRFWEGVAWALVAAVSYALYLVLGAGVMRRVNSVNFTVAANTGAVLATFVVAALTFDPAEAVVTEQGFWWVAAIVVFSTVVPLFLFYEGMRRIGPERASLAALIGPAVTAALAWVLLDETLSPLQMGGFILVVIGIWVLEHPRKTPPAPVAQVDQDLPRRQRV